MQGIGTDILSLILMLDMAAEKSPGKPGEGHQADEQF